MKKNMGTADRVFRILVAIGIAILYLTDVISGTTAIIAMAIGVVFLLTSLVSFCPLYAPFGFRTCKRKA
ncbi:DUF2892 domain-containing protein [Dokdonia sinensis]|uniref:DUF2892 domain-containing protein n=1 Tax=Dokdonia sinensis TaxID=2479847 RepID=A0A3M0H347_9FLAO|nr:DUF2892 domain-containing protein [Dokdonia sinensis]RMB64096.1 DUF2892 domain-containing protein [Dokdonia sinensis]